MGQGRNTFATIFTRHGMPATIIRLVPGGADINVPVKIVRRYAEEEPLDHEMSQDEARFTVQWTELNAAGFPLPIRKNDRVLKDGEYFTIRLVRPLEFQGELCGYEMRCIGG